MRRRISLLLAAMLAGTTLMLFGPAQPASAVVVCGGTGQAIVTPGLLYPILFGIGSPTKTHTISILIGDQFNTLHGFTFSFAPGACVHGANTQLGASAAGVLKGYCGHSAGTGTFENQPFTYVSAGTLLILTGHVLGLANAIPVPLTGSCGHAEGPTPTTTFALPGGATVFQVQGAGVGLNCTNPLGATETLVTTLNILELSPLQLLGVHVYIGAHYWTMGTCVPPGLL